VIVLFNVHYDATADEIEGFVYKNVTIDKVIEKKQGLFLLEVSKDSAKQIVDMGQK